MSLNGKFSHLTFHFLIQSFTHTQHRFMSQYGSMYIQSTYRHRQEYQNSHTAEKCFQISDKFIKFMAIVEWKKAQMELKNWLPISEVSNWISIFPFTSDLNQFLCKIQANWFVGRHNKFLRGSSQYVQLDMKYYYYCGEGSLWLNWKLIAQIYWPRWSRKFFLPCCVWKGTLAG